MYPMRPTFAERHHKETHTSSKRQTSTKKHTHQRRKHSQSDIYICIDYRDTHPQRVAHIRREMHTSAKRLTLPQRDISRGTQAQREIHIHRETHINETRLHTLTMVARTLRPRVVGSRLASIFSAFASSSFSKKISRSLLIMSDDRVVTNWGVGNEGWGANGGG